MNTKDTETQPSPEATSGRVLRVVSLLWCGWEVYLIHAAINGHQGAENVITFLAILQIPCGIMMLGMWEKYEREQEPTVLRLTKNILDLFVVFAAAYAGWFWIASSWMFGTIVSAGIRGTTVKLGDDESLANVENNRSHEG